jgi:hypothetical protein
MCLRSCLCAYVPAPRPPFFLFCLCTFCIYPSVSLCPSVCVCVCVCAPDSSRPSLWVRQLALKHRQNKNQKQRIVLFVGSPLEEDERTLVRLGKKLKKNSVAVDVVNFGEQEENAARLDAFLAAVDSGTRSVHLGRIQRATMHAHAQTPHTHARTLSARVHTQAHNIHRLTLVCADSHLVTVPPGPHVLSDILLSSAVLAGEDGAAPASVARTGPGGSFEFVDSNMDPELAMVRPHPSLARTETVCVHLFVPVCVCVCTCANGGFEADPCYSCRRFASRWRKRGRDKSAKQQQPQRPVAAAQRYAPLTRVYPAHASVPRSCTLCASVCVCVLWRW